MAEMTSVAKVHVIEGRPWKDALMSVVEPRSPYRPWHVADGIEPGDAVIAVLDTDPRSVLTGVGIVGPDGDVDRAIAGIDRWHLNGLLELGTVEVMARVSLRWTAGQLYHRTPENVIAAIGSYRCWEPNFRFGPARAGPPAEADLELLDGLQMPLKALNATL